MHTSGALRRGIEESYLAVIARSGLSAEAQRAKAEETKQSILSLRRYGLLRCARKDVDGAHLPTRYSVIARSSCDEAIHTSLWRHGFLPPSLFELRRTRRFPPHYGFMPSSSKPPAEKTRPPSPLTP